MRLRKQSILRDLDRTLAIFGIIFSIFLIIFLGREFGRAIYVLTGVLALISCIIWLLIRKSHAFDFRMPESRTQTRLCSILFFALFTLSTLSLYFRPELYERPLAFFILTAIMAGMIAWGILVSDRQYTGIILIQILLLGTSIAWSQLLIFPSLVGVDPWYHSAFTNGIINEGFIPGGSYSKLPLFHLMIASTSLLVDLPYKFATMLSVSIGQIICNAMFIFLIANNLFKNHRVGLMASLFVIIANHHIFMSYWSIPNGFGVVFIPIVLYLILSRARTSYQENGAVSRTIIMLLLMAAIVLTHTVAAVGMAVILFVAWVALKLYGGLHNRAKNHIALSIPLGFTVLMFAWWAYASGHIRTLGSLVEWGFSADYFGSSPAEAVSYGISVPLNEQLFNNLGMFLFFTLSFIGIFYMISRRGNSKTFTMSWVMISPLAIGYFSLITGHTVIEHRWWYLAQILLSVPLAIAICLAGTWRLKRPVRAPALISILVVVLSFLLIMSPTANVDNHTFSPNTINTKAYAQSELLGTDFFVNKAVGKISSDSDYCTNPSSSIFLHVYGISPTRLHSLDSSLITTEFDHDGSVKIIRSIFFQEPLVKSGVPFFVAPNLDEHLYSQGFSKIYDGPTMAGFMG